MNLDEDTRFYSIWEKFQKLISDKWIKDMKMEEMHKIRVEFIERKISKLQEDNEELNKYIIKKGDALTQMQSLNEHSLGRLRI